MVIVRHTQRPFLLKPHKLLSMMALPLIASQREIHPSLSNLHQYVHQSTMAPAVQRDDGLLPIRAPRGFRQPSRSFETDEHTSPLPGRPISF